MNDSWFEQIEAAAAFLNIDLGSKEMANLCVEYDLNDASVQAVAHTFEYLKQKKSEKIISTLLRLSRLPLKEPKTFDGFDFNQLHGKHVDALINLPTLSALYAHKNIAFIGPQGVGKTHLRWRMGVLAA